MLEVICVSNSPAKVATLQESLGLLLGNETQWQLTVVDGTKFDIFCGFNHAVAQTRGEHLMFVHDDVQFYGNPIAMRAPLGLLNDPQFGFVGVAGTRLLEASGCWWGFDAAQVRAETRGMAMHPSENPFRLHANAFPGDAALFGQVIVLDGVMLMCHRRTFDRLGGFDSANYQGFHFYDIDITFRASIENLVNIAAPIPLLHGSVGLTSDAWNAARAIFLRKFGHLLPAKVL